MTTDDKYSRRDMLNFPQQLEAPLSRKQKIFSSFLLGFLKCALNLKQFEKKDEYPNLVIFQSYRLGKRWLLKRLKGLASENHSMLNVLTGSKHC